MRESLVRRGAKLLIATFAVSAGLFLGILVAGTLSITYKTKNQGDVIYASHWTTNFSEIELWANGTIDDANLADAGISGVKLKNATIQTSKIALSNITTALLNDLAVTTAKIDNLAVTEGKLGTGAVTVTKLGTGAVTSDKILDATIAAGDLGTGSVGPTALATGAVTAAKIATETCTGFVTRTRLSPGTVPSSFWCSLGLNDGNEPYCTAAFGSETTITDRVPAAMRFHSLRANLTTAPGAGRSYTIFVRTARSTSLSCAVSDSATTCNSTGSITAVANDYISFGYTAAGTPSSPAQMLIAFCYQPN